MDLNGSNVLITGGTGSFGKKFTKYSLKKFNPKKITIFSRDEMKQWKMSEKFKKYDPEGKIEYVIGDVRDKERLSRALENIDIVIHAADMKHIDIIENEPIQACNTNVIGSLNIISASTKYDVPITVAVSTDKACSSESVYGDTKHLMERCFMDANGEDIRFLNGLDTSVGEGDEISIVPAVAGV